MGRKKFTKRRKFAHDGEDGEGSDPASTHVKVNEALTNEDLYREVRTSVEDEIAPVGNGEGYGVEVARLSEEVDEIDGSPGLNGEGNEEVGPSAGEGDTDLGRSPTDHIDEMSRLGEEKAANEGTGNTSVADSVDLVDQVKNMKSEMAEMMNSIVDMIIGLGKRMGRMEDFMNEKVHEKARVPLETPTLIMEIQAGEKSLR
ncbi:unnamed protein product [Arabidopsis arenosa]|uniref:Uncharacterized protein n=1 Tax=Arabidopsis arenosa TaxID=38785 RepID=A0A8S2AKX4_ARAAE|nr:unnamed protein product [Arabidopsis arenosa]